MEEKLAHYTLIQEAGSGAMSTVYQALDTRLGRIVALKLLVTAASADQQSRYIQRLRREASLIARLSHPNVVTIHDVGEHNGRHFLVMEYLSGISLRARMDQGCLSLAETSHILDQVADALDSIHAQGVVHRDIKPSNIMLPPGGGGGPVKLLDFGVARQSDDATLTQTGMLVGSPAYMAPEQVRGEPATPASDLWAVGVLLYEMLAGRAPFSGTNITSVLYQVVHENPAPLSGQSVAVQKIVARALQKNPDRRYGCARELAEALRRAVEVSQTPYRRRRGKKAGAAASLLLTAGVLGACLVVPVLLPGEDRAQSPPARVQPLAMLPRPLTAPAPVVEQQPQPRTVTPRSASTPVRQVRSASRRRLTQQRQRPAIRVDKTLPPRRRSSAPIGAAKRGEQRAAPPIPAAAPVRSGDSPRMAASSAQTDGSGRRPVSAVRPAGTRRAAATASRKWRRVSQAAAPRPWARPSAAPLSTMRRSAQPDAEQRPGERTNLRGTWRGNIWKDPATLVIREQQDSSFTGTITVRTDAGTARLAVAGAVSAETGRITFWATRTLAGSELPNWDLGREQGRVLTGGLMGGLGRDSRSRVYTWSFSRP